MVTWCVLAFSYQLTPGTLVDHSTNARQTPEWRRMHATLKYAQMTSFSLGGDPGELLLSVATLLQVEVLVALLTHPKEHQH